MNNFYSKIVKEIILVTHFSTSPSSPTVVYPISMVLGNYTIITPCPKLDTAPPLHYGPMSLLQSTDVKVHSGHSRI